ncbi:hypothetical protein FLAN108750_10885 [Flavobacterium antarcticum]|uniref:hypothetical protein n=1 Tax=Flavobacterium antarcticum TaxID=271155 RepID=UPI0003B395E4|nr:hypothetical protein [Flavobacterium antarcticum]
MKKITLLALVLLSLNAYSQEHFSGITTSKRVGILNGHVNPSEFANLSSTYEIQLFALSVNVSNNKVGYKDLVKGEDIESLLFDGKENVNFDMNAAIFGPAFGMRYKKWGFGISSKAFIKASIIDLDSDLGNALINDNLNSVSAITNILSDENQRVNATTWGEVGISAARNVFETESHRINAGVTLKFLFPGSYANIGLNKFNGDIRQDSNGLSLTNAASTLNIAYSGNFGASFSETSDYFKSIFGGLNGFATDLGVDYQWLKEDKTYRLKAGAAFRNIGSMTFSGSDNVSERYALNIPNGDPGLNLNEFENAEGLEGVKDVFNNHPEYFSSTSSKDKFKVKLPAVFNLYADYQIVERLSVTAFWQQKMGDEKADNQVSTQNMFTVTPRVTFGVFEAFLPIGNNEISGGTVGFGFRVGGFFLGSNSILSAVTSDSKQADAYLGFRYGFK